MLAYVTSDSDDDVSDIYIDRPALDVQLAQWAIKNSISHSAVGNLLSILKLYHASLPLDPRTFLKTPQTYAIKEMTGPCGQVGYYTHFGIVSGLNDLIQQHHLAIGGRFSLQFNSDGLPLLKSSSMELWPKFKDIVVSKTLIALPLLSDCTVVQKSHNLFF